MFSFSESDLANADKLAADVAKLLIEMKSSSSTALAVFANLIADFVAANVDPDKWAEGLTAVGLLINAALARTGLENGLLKMGSKDVH